MLNRGAGTILKKNKKWKKFGLKGHVRSTKKKVASLQFQKKMFFEILKLQKILYSFLRIEWYVEIR